MSGGFRVGLLPGTELGSDVWASRPPSVSEQEPFPTQPQSDSVAAAAFQLSWFQL